MTRSIGDFSAHSIGVIASPEIIEVNLQLDDQIIIIATDGIWEYISNQNVAAIA